MTWNSDTEYDAFLNRIDQEEEDRERAAKEAYILDEAFRLHCADGQCSDDCPWCTGQKGKSDEA